MSAIKSRNSLDANYPLENSGVYSGRVIDFPLNKELIRGDYQGHTVFGLGKTAIEHNHWVGLVRLGGFHLIFTDLQHISGRFTDAIDKQLSFADRLYEDNPLFTATLKEDIEETREIMADGYLNLNGTVVDYLWLACADHITHRRPTIHPDRVNEHIDPGIRQHTLNVAGSVLGLN